MPKPTTRSNGQLDEAAPDPSSIGELLDAIRGAYERAQQGLTEVRRGQGIPLEEF